MWDRIARLDSDIDKVRKKIKGVEDRKVASEVFDKATLLSLYDLANKGIIDLLFGVIKTGKESSVFLGKKGNKNFAVKIHRIGTGDYRAMLKYIEGDHRFKGVKRGHRSIVYTWVRKEFKNMKRAIECGVRVPKPIAYKNNVLVMEFIGRGEKAAPKLKDCELENPDKVYAEVLDFMKKLYCVGNLVHADMSEYNILMHRRKPVLIDLSSAVIREHPMSDEFLRRDIANITKYFKKDEINALEYITKCEGLNGVPKNPD